MINPVLHYPALRLHDLLKWIKYLQLTLKHLLQSNYVNKWIGKDLVDLQLRLLVGPSRRDEIVF